MAVGLGITFNVEEIGEAIAEAVAQDIQHAARAAIEVAVLSTPVGNPDIWKHPPPPGYKPGAARGNWVVGIGEQPGEENYDPKLLDTVGAKTIKNLQEKVNGYLRANLLRGDNLLIVNPVPYAEGLENGTVSSQGRAMASKAARAAVLAGGGRLAEVLPEAGRK